MLSPSPEPDIALSEPSADEIKTTTCYMCACRCGIQVHLKDGQVRYIDGNRDHPVNKGVLCGKGAAGIMQHYSPARLRAPLLRVGPRGSGEFQEIDWDEALRLATQWLGDVRATRSEEARLLHRPRPEPGADRLVGACSSARRTSPRMAASARSTWRRPGSTRSAARSGSSASRTGSTRATSCCSASPRTTPPTRSRSASASSRQRGVKIVAVNPVRTGYGAIADEWIGIRPGTDGLFVGALIHELLQTPEDRSRLPGALHQRALAGDRRPGRRRRRPVRARRRRQAARLRQDDAARSPMRRAPTSRRRWSGTFTLADGRERACRCSQLIAERFLADEYAPETVASGDGVAGRHHPPHRRASWRMPPSSSRSRSTCPGPTGPAAATRR